MDNNSCQAKQSCQLLASNSIFGDACPGTQKYLEVHYQCVPASQMQPSALNRTGQSMHHPASTGKFHGTDRANPQRATYS